LNPSKSTERKQPQTPGTVEETPLQHDVAPLPAPIRAGSDSEAQHLAVADDRRPCGTEGPSCRENSLRTTCPAQLGEPAIYHPVSPMHEGSCHLRPRRYGPPLHQNFGPVLTLAQIYRSDDPSFTESLADYTRCRGDERFGGWQTYSLQRSYGFIRCCCHLHVAKMYSTRDGAGETRVVFEWPARR